MLHVCQKTTKWADSCRGVLDCQGRRTSDQGCSWWRETARELPGLNSDLAMVDGMREEEKRLMTYANWPPSSQDPAKLAEVGLFYTGQLDRVKCAFCLGVLKEWQPGDIPLVEHRRHFPYCRFIRGEDVGNIPARQSAIHPVPRTFGLRPATCDASDLNQGHGACDMSESMYITPSYASPNYRLISSETKAYTKPSSITMNYPTDKTDAQSADIVAGTVDYTSEASRLATFRHWPMETRILPADLARAGFYHAPAPGKPDRVRCGYCQGKLYAWTGGEDPDMEHKKCFPTCTFVRMTGQDPKTNHSLTSSHTPSFGEGNRATSVPGRLKLSSKNALPITPRDMATANQVGVCERMRGDEGALPKQNMKDVGEFMLSDTVRRVIEMGFARETIEKVVLSKSGSEELSTVRGLVEAVLNYDV